MTNYNFGDVLLVNFPFTDGTGSKKRPSVVISSRIYHKERDDVILAAITGGKPSRSGDVLVHQWKEAGLIKPSVIKPVIFTLKVNRVLLKLGRLNEVDGATLRSSFQVIFG